MSFEPEQLAVLGINYRAAVTEMLCNESASYRTLLIDCIHG